MLSNSRRNISASRPLKNYGAAQKSAQAESDRIRAIEDAIEKERRLKGGGGGGGGVITKGGGSRYGSASEIQSSFIAQNYRAGQRADTTKQIMQANTFSDNAATTKLTELTVANGQTENNSGKVNPNQANLLDKKLDTNQNTNAWSVAAKSQNVLDDFNNPVPRFVEGAISVLASLKILKSEEEKEAENKKTNEEELEEKEELVESALDKLTKLFPVLQTMNDTEYNGNGVFQSIKIRTSKIIKFIFNREKRSPQKSLKDINKLKKLIQKNLDNSQKIKDKTRKLREAGYFQ